MSSSCLKSCSIIVAILSIMFGSHVALNKDIRLYTFPIYTKFQPTYNPHERLMDIQGQTALVTGANAGLGFSTTKILASRGAKVIMACRNPNKASKARQKILDLYPNADLEIMLVDLADMDTVKRFASEFLQKYDALDMFVWNAGLGWPFKTTKDGFNFIFQVNYLAQAYIFDKLEPLLNKRPGKLPSRVVLVSSTFHHHVDGEMDDLLSWERAQQGQMWKQSQETGKGNKDYGISKFAQLAYVRSLSKLDKPYLINAVHPGFVKTEIFEKIRETLEPVYGKRFADFADWFINIVCEPLGMAFSSDVAALIQVHLVAGKDIVEQKISGDYWVPHVYRTVEGDGGASPRVFEQKWLDRNMEITKKFLQQFQ